MEEAVLKIGEILNSVCPSGYSAYFIKDMVAYFLKQHQLQLEGNFYSLSYPESIRVDILDNVVKQIEEDIIKNRHSFIWAEDKEKSLYDQGVLNVIRLIQHRIHCICD